MTPPVIDVNLKDIKCCIVNVLNAYQIHLINYEKRKS
jgi:hypothetical protein